MRIIVRGYRGPSGEIDLIARDGDVLVFVEVKTRRRGQPAEAVTLEKQRRITLTSLHFARKHRLLENVSGRFDVVAIVWPVDGGRPTIEHFRNAFEGRGYWSILPLTLVACPGQACCRFATRNLRSPKIREYSVKIGSNNAVFRKTRQNRQVLVFMTI